MHHPAGRCIPLLPDQRRRPDQGQTAVSFAAAWPGSSLEAQPIASAALAASPLRSLPSGLCPGTSGSMAADDTARSRSGTAPGRLGLVSLGIEWPRVIRFALACFADEC